jgi:hypothetical protein
MPISAGFETQSQEKIRENLWQQLRALTGAERRLLEAVLIHDHCARLSPRVIPGPSQFVALFLRHKMPWIFLTNRPGLTSALMECSAD